jgi:hypothetical protein
MVLGNTPVSSVTMSTSACGHPTLSRGGCAAQWLVSTKTGKPITFAVHKVQISAPLVVGARIANGLTISQPPAAFGTPQYIQRSYDLTALAATAGFGDTVGIVDVGVGYTQLESDLTQYRAQFDLPPCTSASGCLRIVNQNGGANVPTGANGQNSNWKFETAMDVDAISTTCPNCHILVVETSAETVPDYQAAELTADRLGANQISNSWTEFWSFNRSDFTFPGVAVLAATGDYGYLGGSYSTPEPASFPGVTAVGGTSLMQASPSDPNVRGIVETGWAGGSSACSSQPKPAWQVAAGTGCATRSVADISADARAATGLDVYCSCNNTLTGYTGGGTSLATALTAGYYGLLHSRGMDVGVGGAAWAYDNVSNLNAITSGSNRSSNGPCTIATICNNRSTGGYSGITGVGSISGAVLAGPPGVAGGTGCSCVEGTADYVSATPSSTSVTLSGSVYPNKFDTQYWWEYGPTSAYGQTTTPTNIGASASAVGVSDTITGLTPGVSYHFELVASNSAGSVADGPDGITINPVDAPGVVSPTVTISSAPLAATTNTKAQVVFSITGPTTGGPMCTLDAKGVPCVAGSARFNHLRVGHHVLIISVTGPGGVGSSNAVWTVGKRA